MTTTNQTNSQKMETTTPQSKVDTSTVKRCLTEANHNTTEANCNTTQANTSQPHYTTSEPQSTTSLISSTTNQKSSSIPETSSKTTLSVNQTTIISNTSSTIASQLPGSKSHLYSLSKYIQVWIKCEIKLYILENVQVFSAYALFLINVKFSRGFPNWILTSIFSWILCLLPNKYVKKEKTHHH